VTVAQLLDVFGFLSVVLRGLNLALQSLVLGGVVFSLLAGRWLAEEAEAARARRRLLIASALALVLCAGATISANAAILMATANLRLTEVAGASFFIAGVLAALAALAVAALAARPTPQRLLAALLCGLVIVATGVATSHAAARLDNRPAAIALTALHQLATACWIGGLPYLVLWLGRARPESGKSVTARFSAMAQASVAVLLLAGVGLAVLYVGTPEAFLGTTYGLMVAAKFLMFGLLIGLGALNYQLVGAARAGDTSRLTRLRRFAEAEIGIGFTVILTAASLTSQPPATDLVAARVPLREIASRLSPRPPRLTPPAAAERISPAFLTAATAAGDLDSFVPGQLAEPQTAGEIALSEFNHNVSGVVVLAAGLLAVLSKAGLRWARNWPLAFLALAIFLFLLADAEYWPLGPVNFFSGFTVAEVVQHRLAVLLLIAFVVFERNVQTGRAKNPREALVFPIVAALGAALLLTHSHALSNPRDQLLVELSHVPIAICGVLIGWSRWLELRLPDEPRRGFGWIWPWGMVVVGLLLITYRET
jgi:copper resistance protein D